MKAISLGDLEKEVMDILWENNSYSIREILTELSKHKKLAYTTVATILQRLHEKGLVNKKKDKLGYIYSPKFSKKSYSKSIAQSFLDKFINSFGDTGIASFAESIDNLPVKKKEYFLNLLEDHDKNK